MTAPDTDREPLWSEVDADDVVESFLGSLAAMLVVTLVLWLLLRGARCRDQQPSR